MVIFQVKREVAPPIFRTGQVTSKWERNNCFKNIFKPLNISNSRFYLSKFQAFEQIPGLFQPWKSKVQNSKVVQIFQVTQKPC